MGYLGWGAEDKTAVGGENKICLERSGEGAFEEEGAGKEGWEMSN